MSRQRQHARTALTADPTRLAATVLLLARGAAAAAPERSPLLPGMAGVDPRTRVDGGQAPWRAVARLQVPGTAAVLGGYNQDHAEVIEADAHCAVTGLARDRQGGALLLHDCSATRGTSGGPLLLRGENGGLLLAGIQVGARKARAGGLAVPAETLRRLLTQP